MLLEDVEQQLPGAAQQMLGAAAGGDGLVRDVCDGWWLVVG
jgi:hypothetical protein